MKVEVLAIGKNHDPKLATAIDDYSQRLNHYVGFSWKILDAKTSSSASPEYLKKIESELLVSNIDQTDKVILLDETGQQLSSLELADRLQSFMNQSVKKIVFVIGGAYGVSDEIIQRSDLVLSLSKLVFPHQLVRLILAEQLYRAHTILAGEKYHHN